MDSAIASENRNQIIICDASEPKLSSCRYSDRGVYSSSHRQSMLLSIIRREGHARFGTRDYYSIIRDAP